MTLLDAERSSAPEASAQTPPVAPDAPEQQPSAGALACSSCGAEMAPEQDWCLNCGAAASGRLGERPGWRAFATIAALTLVLVLGAVAASYAALSTDKRKPAVATAPPAAVAQATPPPAPTTSTPAPAQNTPPAAKGSLPKVKAPSTPSGQRGSAGTPVTPSTTPKVTTQAPKTSSPRTTTTPTTTTPTASAPVAIKLTSGAASTYDPYGKAAATGDAARALDGDSSTSWYIDPKAADGPIGAGYTIDLGAQKAVKRIQVTTTTPGFRVEVYATDEATPPPDITDTRWSHITNASGVGKGSGQQTIVVGGGSSKYQTVLLWITERPSDGARVRISELKLFG